MDMINEEDIQTVKTEMENYEINLSYGSNCNLQDKPMDFMKSEVNDLIEDNYPNIQTDPVFVDCKIEADGNFQSIDFVSNSDLQKDMFHHLLPTAPIPVEMLQEEVNVRSLPSAIKQTTIQKYICTGQDNNLQPHEADEETFKKKGICKDCLYAAFDDYTKNKSKQTDKQTDVILNKINSEINKLESSKKQDLQNVISKKHCKNGLDLKERLRGIGMGFHPENKNRKVQQFEHNSILSYYGFGLKCVTLVYDPIKNDLLMVGAPEVKEQLSEISKKMKEEGSKDHLENATNIFKEVFKKSATIPHITPEIQNSAATVWKNTFAKRTFMEESEVGDCSDVTKPKTKKNKTKKC